MKTTQLLTCLAASYFSPAVLAAPDQPRISPRARDEQLKLFEERYINRMEYVHPNSTVKLIGFKKIIMTATESADMEKHIAERPTEWDEIDMAYWDPIERAMRVYFPVENALVHHNGELVEANHLGEFAHDAIDGDCAVVGRYQTEQVTGVPANRIEDGIIYLVDPSPVQRKHGNVHVYDFGWRHGMHHHEEDGLKVRGDGDGGSCYSNHGNRVCSFVYNINQGRCDRPSSKTTSCIDYNGWPFKNCKNHSDKKAFPLSDCFISVARGHCWNELERAA